jgi:membrane protein implicated in regulation of membrane protease activity
MRPARGACGADAQTMTMTMMLSLSAFSVFLAIAAVGFIFLMVSAASGEIFEHFDGIDDHGGPGFFSTRVIAVFVTAFGASGAVATYYGLGAVPASIAGSATGLVFGGAIGMLGRFLYRQQASSEVRAGDLVGQIARVIVAIPSGGVGQIRCRVGEELVDKIARTRDGDPVSENTSVLVEEVLGETVIVRKH